MKSRTSFFTFSTVCRETSEAAFGGRDQVEDQREAPGIARELADKANKPLRDALSDLLEIVQLAAQFLHYFARVIGQDHGGRLHLRQPLDQAIVV